jgi:hypothetical protein
MGFSTAAAMAMIDGHADTIDLVFHCTTEAAPFHVVAFLA